jgi:DNA-binding NtrC family response regulator
MDDEEIVRSVVGAILAELGYEAVLAREGNEAVRLYREALGSEKAFDAVIMDLTIPGGKGGRDAVKELLVLDPQVKAIVSSGYSNDPIMSDFTSHGFVDVVKKPFNVRDLSDTLHRIIGGRPNPLA